MSIATINKQKKIRQFAYFAHQRLFNAAYKNKGNKFLNNPSGGVCGKVHTHIRPILGLGLL